jgi:tetratricopeptide (TPR) repeat protein
MRRPLTALLTLLALATAAAQTVAVHPFTSNDDATGVLVAERLARSLDVGNQTPVGPAVAPSLVAPFAFQEGYASPLALLADGEIATPHGVRLLRSGSGADIALTGAIRSIDDGLELTMYAEHQDGRSFTATVRAPLDRPSRLATDAARVLAATWGLERDALVPPATGAGAESLARAVALLGNGLIGDAERELVSARDAGLIDASGERYLAAIRAVRAGETFPDAPMLAAVIALSSSSDPERTLNYFEAADPDVYTSAPLWVGALARDDGQTDRAADAYAAAATQFAYGAAAELAFKQASGDLRDPARLLEQAGVNDAASLVAVTFLADLREDTGAERQALETLTRVLPTFTWPFERLSFLAFDIDDADLAARVLEVALELDATSSLYWTNLGWARYLQGRFDASREASARALEVDDGAYIAAFNLGLVDARFGRLEAAMEAYDQAVALDPEVDDEALQDVVNAIEAEPRQPALRFALGTLYAAEGRRAEAAQAFEAFLELGGHNADFDAQAQARIAALTAPLPPLEIAGDRFDLLLGATAIDGAAQPGDPLTFRFEVITPGDALPRRLEVAAALVNEAGETVAAPGSLPVDVPPDAIGYVIDGFGLELPRNLPSGTYTLQVNVESRDQSAPTLERTVNVTGEASVPRILLGRGLDLVRLNDRRSLIARDPVPTADALASRLVGVLRAQAELAEGSLPTVENGRFEGLSGGELFNASTPSDVRDFLETLIAQGLSDTDLVFVEAYAEWALSGAGTP